MAAINEETKSISYYIKRKSSSGYAVFKNNDTLFARITPCTENGKICLVKDISEYGLGSTELKTKYQKLVNQKQEIYRNLPESQTATKEKLNREIEEIFMNDRLYVYSLNIRGLILYIVAEIEYESKINSERHTSKKRKVNYNPQISKVIENLAKHYPKKFPFLYNYIEMKKIISKIDLSKNFERHYEIKILRKIAEELKHQIYFYERYSNLDLDVNNNNLIYYWVTKRYFTELYHYFIHIYKFLDEVKRKEFNLLLKDYKEKMLVLMREYLEKEEKSVQHLLYE